MNSASTNTTIRLVGVFGCQDFRAAAHRAFAADGGFTCIDGPGDAAGLPALLRRHRPHVTLIDMARKDVFDQAQLADIAECVIGMRIFLVGENDDAEWVHNQCGSRVQGYMHRRVSSTALPSAIRAACLDDGCISLYFPRPHRSAHTPAPPPNGPLSLREVEILTCVADAMSNRQIAGHLGITEGTVKRHLRNIFAKLGAVSRIDSVNKAKDLGLLRQPALSR